MRDDVPPQPRIDRPGKDCGDAILGDAMGIEMICNNCIALRREPSGPTGMMGMFAAMTGDALPLLRPPPLPHPAHHRSLTPASAPAAASAGSTGDRGASNPRRRTMSTLLVFALGLLVGRFASGLPDGATGLLDVGIAALLAVSVTLMWRRWARRAMESRRLEQQRRAGAKH